MKINWKLRLQNRVVALSAITLALDIIYNILAMCGITPPVSEHDVLEVVERVIEILAIVGILTDPTTQGLHDSEKAMQYTMPNKPELPKEYWEGGEDNANK